ncbi:MAG: 30S ribosomal protein S1 [Anaerolineae bacterium]
MVAFRSDLESANRFVAMARELWEDRHGKLLDRNAPSQADYGARIPPEVERYWDDAQQVFDRGDVVSAQVTGWNRGGLLVRWGHLQGFVPASQMSDVKILSEEDNREAELARWVGEDLELKIIELDATRNRLVFSQRATRWGPREGDRVLAEVEPGQIREGTVSNLCDFGAFVDLGGIDGLVHLSELSWRRVNHPCDMLEIGERVRVRIIGVDRDRRRIALSIKQLRPNPWDMVDQKYELDQVIEARVTNVVEFGVFAQIEEGLEGLVHVSEMPESHDAGPAEIVRVGEQIRVRIIRIDSDNQRLGLSMRGVDGDPPAVRDDSADGTPTFLY